MNELRGRLIDLWDELEGVYGAVVPRTGFAHWDWGRLRFEVWWAERRLRVLLEGVKAGWLPPVSEDAAGVPEGWAA